MESASIFVWRMRLCVVLAVAGQSFVNFDKHETGTQQQLLAQKTSQHVKCAEQPHAGAPTVRDARTRLDCGHVASRSTPLKTSNDHRVVLPPDAASMKSTHWSVR